MRAYVVVDAAGYTDVFIGNGDELTPAVIESLAGRVRKLGGKLLVRSFEPVSELPGYVESLEEEVEEVRDGVKKDGPEPTDSGREDKHDFKKEGG